MALKIEDSKLFITGAGHVLVAPLDTPWPTIENFKFGDSSTYGQFTWIGDTSAENVIEFDVEGGEVEFKDTFDRKKAKSKRTDREITGTVNSVNFSRETFELAFPAGKWNEDTKSYTAENKVLESTKKFLIITEDGTLLDAFGFYKTTLAGTIPTFGVDEFAEIPVKIAALPDKDNKLFEIWEPREYKKPAAAGVPGG